MSTKQRKFSSESTFIFVYEDSVKMPVMKQYLREAHALLNPDASKRFEFAKFVRDHVTIRSSDTQDKRRQLKFTLSDSFVKDAATDIVNKLSARESSNIEKFQYYREILGGFNKGPFRVEVTTESVGVFIDEAYEKK